MSTFQFSPNGQAAYGYRPLPDGGLAATAMGQYLIVAAIGVALGTTFGIVVAAAPWIARTPSVSPDLSQVSAAPATLPDRPILPATVQAPLVQSQAVDQANIKPSIPQEPLLDKTSATVQSLAVYRQRHAVHKAFGVRTASARRKAYNHYRPHVFLEAPAVALLPPVREPAKPAVTPVLSTLIIEGDLTVANFDASAGMVETNEGKTFILGGAVGAATSAVWQESSSNVHYRCTQSGSCTLFHAGVVFPNVRVGS
jgi:hypothetical protein